MSHATVTVTDKVFLSLRTEDPETAKTRFRLAALALDQYFAALETGPQPLTRTQRTALVGDIYRDATRDLDTDDAFLDAIEATTSAFDADVAHHIGKMPDGETADEANYGAKPADEKAAELMAAIDMYDPKALAAWSLKYETDPAKRTVALEQLYGPLVDDEIARKQVLVDEPSRSLTLDVMDQVADAFGDMATRRLNSLDFTDPFAAGLPAWSASKQPRFDQRSRHAASSRLRICSRAGRQRASNSLLRWTGVARCVWPPMTQGYESCIAAAAAMLWANLPDIPS